jgi:hypothetical protein
MDGEVRVYSLSWVRDFPNGNRGLSFAVFENKSDLKREVLAACDELVPGEDVVKIGLSLVPKEQYEGFIEILRQETNT